MRAYIKLLHIRCLGPRVEREERADDPVAEVGVVLVVMHFLIFVVIIPVGVRRATEAEANTPDVELTRGVGIVRDGVTLGGENFVSASLPQFRVVWPFKHALLLQKIIRCSQGNER